MVQSVKLKAEPIQSLGYASISGTYALVGVLPNPAQIYFVQNLTNAIVTFSQDGVTDNFVLPANGFLLIDVGTNRGLYETLSFTTGTPLYAKGSVSSGSVYLSTFYMG